MPKSINALSAQHLNVTNLTQVKNLTKFLAKAVKHQWNLWDTFLSLIVQVTIFWWPLCSPVQQWWTLLCYLSLQKWIVHNLKQENILQLFNLCSWRKLLFCKTRLILFNKELIMQKRITVRSKISLKIPKLRVPPLFQ